MEIIRIIILYMSTFIETFMNKSRATPESIAKKIIKTMEAKYPPLRVPVTIDALFFTLLRRIAPRGIYHRLLYKSLPSIKKWRE